MQEKKFTRAKKVIDALRMHYGEKVGEFANRLGVGASTVSTWSNRDTLDEDLIFRKCKGVNYDFLLTGEGSAFVSEITLTYDPDLQRIIDTWPELRDSQRAAIISVLDAFSKPAPQKGE